MGDRVVCVDTLRDRVHMANPVAALMWRLHAGGAAFEDVVAAVRAEYDVSEERAARDVGALLEALQVSEREAEAFDREAALRTLPPAPGPLRPVAVADVELPGVAVRLEAESGALVDHFRTLFADPPKGARVTPAWRVRLEVHDAPEGFVIVEGGTVRELAHDPLEAAVAAMREVAAAVARACAPIATFHAGAVARDGRAVLFPARSGSGKTTLTAYLAAHGFSLLNDDVVPLGRDGRLIPIPLALSVKAGSWPVLAGEYPGLASRPVAGLPDRPMRLVPAPFDAHCPEPVPCAAIVLPEYAPDARAAELTPLPTEAVLEHVVDSHCLMDRPIDPAMLARMIEWIDARGRYRLRYAALDEAAPCVERLCRAG